MTRPWTWVLLLLLPLGVAAGVRILRLQAVDGPPAGSSRLLANAVVGAIAAGASSGEGAPSRSWDVTTELGHHATLRIEPDDAWRGAREGQVAVVVFGDFASDASRRAVAEIGQLHAVYADRVLFAYKHFPRDRACNPGTRDQEPYACAAAEAAACAGEQGLFWPMHDRMYKNQHQLRPADLRRHVAAVGADAGRFEACTTTGVGRARVAADGAQGEALDLGGTPRIWIDGQLYRGGASAEQMARAIELGLGSTAPQAHKAARLLGPGPEDFEPVGDEVPAMREVTRTASPYRIDTFEASVRQGAAISARGAVPAVGATWFDARDACAAAGKRLCTEEEWVTACQGAASVDDDGDGEHADDFVEGTTHPYGDLHDPRRCWDGKPDNEPSANGATSAFRPVYTGEMPGCVSVDGVYDLTGNVEEWVGATPETAALLGGAYDTRRDHARCHRRNDTFGPGYASRRTGFRCCAAASSR